MTTLTYAAIAIAFLILVIRLRRKRPPLDMDEAFTQKSYAPRIGNRRWLHLSERIFDPTDARWLAEELGFPKLANALIIDRKRLAIRWLEALQASFEEVVRTPELAPSEAPEMGIANSWQMLWLTLRFKFLVSYALLVVKLLGPYHRLIPSFSWVPSSQETRGRFRRSALANSRSSD